MRARHQRVSRWMEVVRWSAKTGDLYAGRDLNMALRRRPAFRGCHVIGAHSAVLVEDRMCPNVPVAEPRPNVRSRCIAVVDGAALNDGKGSGVPVPSGREQSLAFVGVRT